MDSSKFIEHMIEAFEDRVQELSLETKFRELAEWDSLVSIATLAMVFVEYDVQVSGDELLECKTIGDLMALVEEKQKLAA